MKRDTRTFIVLLVATVTAGLATFGVYRWIRSIPVREVEVAHLYVVAATRPLAMGTRVSAADVKLVAWPTSAPMPGALSSVEAVVNRGLVTAVQENEPLTESKLASAEAGAGLSPTIPSGMRAISVRVNEVIGVAGFVTPGTRVDVFATLQQPQGGFTQVVVSNVQVLTAGTRYEQDQSKPGEAIPSSVVTLLLSPEDAERVVLASAEAQIMLALRNPLDPDQTVTPGTKTGTLFGRNEPAPPVTPVVPKVVAVRRTPMPPAPSRPVVAPEPKPYTVDTIRGAKRTAEIVRLETEGRAQ